MSPNPSRMLHLSHSRRTFWHNWNITSINNKMFMHCFVDSTFNTDFNVSSNFFATCKTKRRINNKSKNKGTLHNIMWSFEYLIFIGVSKKSIQIWMWPFISVPNSMCMCKILPLRRLRSKVTIFVVQNFQKVTNFHKICVPHDDYLKLAVNLSNTIPCSGILH